MIQCRLHIPLHYSFTPPLNLFPKSQETSPIFWNLNGSPSFRTKSGDTTINLNPPSSRFSDSDGFSGMEFGVNFPPQKKHVFFRSLLPRPWWLWSRPAPCRTSTWATWSWPSRRPHGWWRSARWARCASAPWRSGWVGSKLPTSFHGP